MKVDSNKINILKEEAMVSILKVDFEVSKPLYHLQKNHLRWDLKIQMLGAIPGTSSTTDMDCGQSVCLSIY